MKKKLLFSLFALVASVSTYAQAVGDYLYTYSQKVTVSGENKLANGDFSDGTTGWTSVDGESVDAEAWSVEAGAGPNGETVLTSMGADKNGSLCQSVAVEVNKSYAVSFWVKGETLASTTAGQVFIDMDGSLTKPADVPGVFAPVTVVPSVTYGTEWTQVVGIVAVSDTLTTNHEGIPTLVINFTALPTNVSVAKFSVNEVSEVFDSRKIQRLVDQSKALMADPNFTGDKSELQSAVEAAEGGMEQNAFDDPNVGESILEALNVALIGFLDQTTVDLTSLIPGLDITSQDYYGRAGIGTRAATYKLNLVGNWGHLNSEPDALRSAIQLNYEHSATYNAYHEDLPAGKYFFACEIRNANTTKTSWPTEPQFTLESTCTMGIGDQTKEVGPISGEYYQWYYMIGDVAEDGKVNFSMYWPGVASGGAFFIRNTVARAFSMDVLAQAEHVAAFKKYIVQWNAAVSARNAVDEALRNTNYPWDKQILRDALAEWDPYFNAQAAKGWATADGKDAGIASTDELNDWALYQGVEAYNEETGDRLQYQVVRGYQNATNAVKESNKPFTDLATAIDEAKKTRNQGTNLTGDRDAYKEAILKAIATITEIRENTTDEKKEEDAAKLTAALEELNAATEAFLASVTLPDLANIDFSTPLVENDNTEVTAAYYVEGNPGRIYLSNGQPDNTDNTAQLFALGWNGEYNDVLRVGNGTGTVYVGELTDQDAIDFEFDIWHGKLSGKNCYVELRNAAGTKVAGFSVNAYNGSLAFNDFDNDEHKGLDILSYYTGVGSSSASNAAIMADNNRTHYRLSVNYIKGTLQGTMTNPQKGTCEGVELPIPEVDDNKIAAFVIGSNYNNSDRRCWFDNLRIVKYSVTADMEEDITATGWGEIEGDGIVTIANEAQPAAGIYNLNGMRVNKVQKGLYIQNGKKYVVK